MEEKWTNETQAMDAIQEAKEEMHRKERRALIGKNFVMVRLLRKLTKDFPEGLRDDVEIIIEDFTDNGL